MQALRYMHLRFHKNGNFPANLEDECCRPGRSLFHSSKAFSASFTVS